MIFAIYKMQRPFRTQPSVGQICYKASSYIFDYVISVSKNSLETLIVLPRIRTVSYYEKHDTLEYF